MVGQRQEAAIELPVFAREDRFNHGLQVIVNHSLRRAAEEGERPIVGVEHHLLRLAQIRHHEGLTTVGKAEVRHLYALHGAVQFNVLVAPIELDRPRQARMRAGRRHG